MNLYFLRLFPKKKKEIYLFLREYKSFYLQLVFGSIEL